MLGVETRLSGFLRRVGWFGDVVGFNLCVGHQQVRPVLRRQRVSG